MNKSMILAATLFAAAASLANAQTMKLNNLDYYEKTGANILVYSNIYNGGFCDEKQAGMEIIQRGERIATGGGVRFMNTPEQWDIYATMTDRRVDHAKGCIEVDLDYKDYDFKYTLKTEPKGEGILVSILLDNPLPSALVGKAGFNLEFFPASYFGKSYLADDYAGILPKDAQHNTMVRPISEKIPQYFGESTFDDRGRGEFLVPLPISSGKRIVLAPEDKTVRVSVSSNEGEISLYDGRLLAQNGCFVLRSLLPDNKTGVVLEWYIEPDGDATWIRKPNIGFSQIGYIPAQNKVAVIELDRNDTPAKTATIYKIGPDGNKSLAYEAKVEPWGVYYHRYNYVKVDFSQLKTPGLYCIVYNGVETNAFPINEDVYKDKWYASMDISLVVAMDHMEVNEGYRIWHGRANMDDAIMAPANISLHDGYRQGPENFTKYKPLEHVPGLAVGGWYDAGDFDIQQNSVVTTTQDLASLWRLFKPERDMTYIDQQTKYADIHRPDGIPDVVQQIMHGTLNMNAQIEALGFMSSNIGQPQMHQYHHLGDALTLTDGLIYDPSLKPYEISADGKRSGTYDDRIIMTRKPTAASTMNAVIALASAYPALKDWFPEEAERSLKNAVMLWEKYSTVEETDQMYRRWAGADNRVRAAIELWTATGEQKYKDYFLPKIIDQVKPKTDGASAYGSAFYSAFNFENVLRVYDLLDKKTRKLVDAAVPEYIASLSKLGSDTPYNVPISGSGWGGNNQVMSTAFNCYLLWKKYPEQVDPDLIFRGLNYIYGCHPYSNVSFVNSVGVNTKKVAYGNNRADYSVIPGGIVPGLMVKKPDFLECKDDYPFLWGENECCINSVPNYVMLTLATQEVAEYLSNK